MNVLTLDTLDACIRAVEEARSRPVVRIYLNHAALREFIERMGQLTHLEPYTRTAFGIPVILSATIPKGMFMLEYETLGGPQLIGWSLGGKHKDD